MMATLVNYKAVTRDIDRSLAQIAADPVVKRETADYRARISNIKSVDDFMRDNRVYTYALKAHGLEDMAYAKAFIRKVLEDGTQRGDALANRLANKAYRDFSAAFGFGTDTAPNTRAGDFADRILGRYEARQFEIAVAIDLGSSIGGHVVGAPHHVPERKEHRVVGMDGLRGVRVVPMVELGIVARHQRAAPKRQSHSWHG
ncbi:MAG: DUF1217 domain-containing protein [Phyllobacteriaceae bacterium]|nr:DUF1217 domain-containing protein [Phyllobacteriaceae bacterium]